MDWSCDSDKDKCKYNSKIPTGTWLPPQYVKQWVLKFRLATFVAPKRTSTVPMAKVWLHDNIWNVKKCFKKASWRKNFSIILLLFFNLKYIFWALSIYFSVHFTFKICKVRILGMCPCLLSGVKTSSHKQGCILSQGRLIFWREVWENLNSIHLILVHERLKETFQVCHLSCGFFAKWAMQAIIINTKMGGKDGYKGSLEAASVTCIYLVREIREKSSNFQKWPLRQPWQI